MIIEYVRYQVPLKEAKDFLGAVDRAQAALAEAPECLAWEMVRGVEDPTQWVIRIEWESLAAHQEGFRAGPNHADYMRPLRRYHEYLAGSAHYKANDVQARK